MRRLYLVYAIGLSTIFIITEYQKIQKMDLLVKTTNQAIANLNAIESKQCIESIYVTVVSYSNVPSQTSSNPDITAFNYKLRPGMIAVSRDLLDMGFIPGRKVWLEGIGVYTIGDVMNARFKLTVDVFIPKESKQKHFKHENVRMVMVR